jgi:hypothetical protein
MRSVCKLTAVLAAFGAFAGGLAFASAPALAAEQWSIVGTFGGATSTPADPQPLSDPTYVAVNESKNSPTNPQGEDVYVVDKANNRVEYFSSTGAYIGQFNAGAAPTGAFSSPGAIAVDNSGSESDPSKEDVYVIDTGHDVVDKFSANGKFLRQVTAGAGRPPFSGLEDVAVSPSGDLWVLCQENEEGRMREFSDAAENAYLASVEPARTFAIGDSDMAVNSEGNLYAGTGDYTGVGEVNLSGEVISEKLGSSEAASTGLSVDLPSNNVYIDETASIGLATPVGGAPFVESFGEGPLSAGAGIAVSSASGDLYVAEPANNRVFVFEHSAVPQTPPPAPSTEPAKEVTSTSWTLEGKLNPGGVAGGVGYYFSYNAGAGSSCTGPGSVKTLFDGGGANVTGSTARPVSATVSLRPHEQYSFCLVADKYGASAGPELSLTTGAAKPEIVSESASSADDPSENTGRFVEFTAEVNPESEETSYYLEYSEVGVNGNEEFEGEVKTVGGEAPLAAEFGERPASVGFKGPGYSHTYYYRMVATNGAGTTKGKVQTYTKLPLVENEKFSALTSSSVKLEAKVNADFIGTIYRFEYATSEEALLKDEGTKLPGTEEIGERSVEPNPVSVEVFGLQSGQTYYFRVVAENEVSQNTGNINKGAPIAGVIKEFTPYAVPVPTTGEAQGVTGATAALSGVVNPEGAEATYYFQYVSEARYQAALAEGASNPYAAGETTVPLKLTETIEDGGEENGRKYSIVVDYEGYEPRAVGPISASGLLPGTTYHYALVATNKFGARGTGQDGTFTTTAPTPPLVSTGGTSAISQNSATLSGTVSTNGLQTNYGFEIGTEPGNYGPAMGLGSIGGALTNAVSVTLNELQPGTTYYYRVTATNADGTVQGQPVSFTTPGFPTLVLTPASPPLIPYISPGFPKEEKGSGTTTKTLTNQEKLKKALKACMKKPKKQRAGCKKQAHKQFGPPTKKRKKKA